MFHRYIHILQRIIDQKQINQQISQKGRLFLGGGGVTIGRRHKFGHDTNDLGF